MDSSPDLRKLLEADRVISAPTAADRRRNRRTLARQIGLGALASASVATTSSWGARIASGAVVKWMSAVVLVGASSATAMWLAPSAPPPKRQAPAAAPLPKKPAEAQPPTREEPELAPPTETVAPPAAGVDKDSKRPTTKEEPARPVAAGPSLSAAQFPDVRDDLDAEARLLSQARSAMRAGNPGQALALLDQGQARFHAGALHEESAATRVFALCQLGRSADARAASTSFVRRFPTSPLSTRVRDACAGKP